MDNASLADCIASNSGAGYTPTTTIPTNSSPSRATVARGMRTFAGSAAGSMYICRTTIR